MARTRIISQSKALFVSPTGLKPSWYGGVDTGGSGLVPVQLNRIDKFSFDTDLAGGRQDVREFGQLARLGVIRLSELSPKLSFGYYLTDGGNEHQLGLSVKGMLNSGASVGLISGILAEDIKKREKNMYLLTVEEGADAASSTPYTTIQRGNHTVVGFGNATLSSYGINLAVGDIPRADVEMDCANIVFYTGMSSGLACSNPSVNRANLTVVDSGVFVLPNATSGVSQVDVLKPGSVQVTFSNNSAGFGGALFSGIHLQSAKIDIPLSRQTIEKLGSLQPFAKPLETPINVTCALNGIVNDFGAGALSAILTGCSSQDTNIIITVADRCNASTTNLQYLFKNAVLDSQNFSIGLDDNESVDLTFSAQLGGGSSTGAGVYMSGAFSGINVGGSLNTFVSGYDNEKPNWMKLV